MALDISFDKIAGAYDAQRAHPPAVAATLARALLGAIGPDARCLELGVGTGRIALPCVEAGGRLLGLDISAGMLAMAAQRAAARGLALDLIRGDAQRLPFADASFDAALVVHVLHLLPDWRAGLTEIVRVLRPGGRLIQGSDWRDPDSCVGLLRGRLRAAVIGLLPGARPPGAGAAITQALARLGGVTAEPQVAVRWIRPLSPADVLAGMAARIDAETWALPDDLLAAALAQVRAWAEARWGSRFAEPQEIEQRFTLTVTTFFDQIPDCDLP